MQVLLTEKEVDNCHFEKLVGLTRLLELKVA
jgi:hypothetical protein